MPRLQKIKRLTLAAARDLADEFCASLTATLLKMTLLNKFPMIIVCHNKTNADGLKSSPMIQPWWFPEKAWIGRRSPPTCCLTELLNRIPP